MGFSLLSLGMGLVSFQLNFLGFGYSFILFSWALLPFGNAPCLSWVSWRPMSLFFCNLQFTISASLPAQGALFLLARLLEKDKPHEITGGFLLVFVSLLLAVLIRFDEFLVTLFCAVPFILYTLRGNWPRVFKKPMFPFLVTSALVLISVPLFSQVWHKQIPGWHEFDLFDHERVEFQDYRIHDYTPQTKPFFEEAGWTKNDLDMFTAWYFMDRDKYDWKNIQRLSRHFPRFGVEGKNSTFHSLLEIVRSNFGMRNLSILFCLMFLIPLAEFRWLLGSVIWLALFFLYMLYFWRAPDRLVYQELYYLLCLGILWAQGPFSPAPLSGGVFPRWVAKTGYFLIALAFFFLVPVIFRIYSDNKKNIDMETQLKSDLARLNPREDQLFIIWDSAFPYELIDAFDSYETFRPFHIFEFAVYQRSPDAAPQLKRFGLENPLMDLIGKPNVYFICKPEELEMYWRFLSEHHSQKVVVSNYFESRFFKVFQILPRKDTYSKTHS